MCPKSRLLAGQRSASWQPLPDRCRSLHAGLLHARYLVRRPLRQLYILRRRELHPLLRILGWEALGLEVWGLEVWEDLRLRHLQALSCHLAVLDVLDELLLLLLLSKLLNLGRLVLLQQLRQRCGTGPLPSREHLSGLGARGNQRDGLACETVQSDGDRPV